MDDSISRQAAINAFDAQCWERINIPICKEIRNAAKDTVKALSSTQPEIHQGTRIFQEIMVEYPDYYNGKPYFSIKYTEDGQGFIGYGTYKPEVLSEYLKEYFLHSAQPEIVRCKDCKHSEPWYRDKSRCFLWHEEGIDVFNDGFCNYAERKEGADG